VAPIDQVGVGKLEDDAVADSSGGAKGFGAVAGDPHAGHLTVGPGKFCRNTIKINSFASVQVAEDADEFLEILKRGRFLAEDAAGAVAAANTEFHASMGNEIEGGEKAGGYSHVTHGRVGDAGAQAHLLGIGSHESKEREWLFPDDVGIKNPAEGKAGGFRLACEAQDSVYRNVRLDGDAEVHAE